MEAADNRCRTAGGAAVTPLTAEQYSELVRMLEDMREYPDAIGIPWQIGLLYTPFACVYLTQWFHRIGPIESHAHFRYVCDRMVAELCEERC